MTIQKKCILCSLVTHAHVDHAAYVHYLRQDIEVGLDLKVIELFAGEF